MPTFDVDREEITAFEVDGTYLFKQYFDRDDVFDALESYYDSDNYWFEVPENELDNAQQILDEYFLDLRIDDDLHNYCVVMEQGVLRNLVLTRRRGRNVVFLMKDLLSVEQAVEQGATWLSRQMLTQDYRMDNRLIIPPRPAIKTVIPHVTISGFNVGLH